VRKLNISDLEFTPLVRTGTRTGTVDSNDVFGFSPFGMGGNLNESRRQVPTDVPYVLAAHIRGKVAGGPSFDPEGSDGDGEDGSEEAASDADETEAETAPGDSEINVVLVADIDMLHRNFFRLREQGAIPEAGIHFDFDNVTFVLNVLDMLAGDDRFLEIRKRRPRHRTLTRIEESTAVARKETAESIETLRDKFEKTEEEEEDKLQKKIDELEKEMQSKNLPAQEVLIRVAMAKQDGERRKQTKLEQLKQERDKEINRIETELKLKVDALQGWYKAWAVVLPPIPPLALAVVVFLTRRVREREGVARSRLR
jgi:ABC-2 type transport system permease protein